MSYSEESYRALAKNRNTKGKKKNLTRACELRHFEQFTGSALWRHVFSLQSCFTNQLRIAHLFHLDNASSLNGRVIPTSDSPRED